MIPLEVVLFVTIVKFIRLMFWITYNWIRRDKMFLLQLICRRLKIELSDILILLFVVLLR